MSQERKFNSLRKRQEVSPDPEVPNLQDLLSRKEEDLNKTRATLDGIREERDQLRRKVHNLISDLNRLKGTNFGGSFERLSSPTENNAITGTRPISKKAERVKLRKTEFIKQPDTAKGNHIHGRDLDPTKLSSAATGHVLHRVLTSSGTQEIFCDLEPNFVVEKKLREKFELEMDRISCQFDQLKSENNLLRLTLQESKSKTEQLQMLLSKYESNNTAHTMALFYSELMSEAFDALLFPLEKDIVKNIYSKDFLMHSKGSHRLQRSLSALDLVLQDKFILSIAAHNLDDFLEQSLERYDHCTEMTSSNVVTILDLCREINERKKAVKRSIVNLESFSIEALQSPLKSERSVSEFDLENAVLLHELASVKEELINLKYEYRKANDDESRSTSFENPDSLKLDSKSSTASSFDFAFNGSLQSINPRDAESELYKKPAFLSLADLRIGTMTESELGTELSEALKREERLKKGNDRLAFTLQRIQQNSENRHIKSMEVMSSLKLSYSTLLENTKRDKLKHASRVQELDRVLAMSEEEHRKQITELKRKILVYQRERENMILPDNETAI